MDSEHRHELKTNELAEWIGHAPQYLRENVRTIIGLTLIVIALVTWPMFNRMRARTDMEQKAQTTELIEQVGQTKLVSLQSQMQGGGSTESLVLTANSLEIAADEASSGQLSALALISRGEALRADLHFKSPDVETVVVEDRIAKARRAYEQAVEKAGGNMSLAAMAIYGLGLCAEELGDFDEAGRIYKSIVENADFEGTVFPARAQTRLEQMDDNKGIFVFVDAPKPVEPVPGIEGLGPIEIDMGGESGAELLEDVSESAEALGVEEVSKTQESSQAE
jgi:tetratricopeptide (TPR) repeat protein